MFVDVVTANQTPSEPDPEVSAFPHTLKLTQTEIQRERETPLKVYNICFLLLKYLSKIG